MAMKLSIGKVPFPIEFDNGVKDVIYFNPNDPDLSSRLMKAQDSISKKINALVDGDIKYENDGTVVIPKEIEEFGNLSEEEQKILIQRAEAMSKLMETTNKIICDEIDVAFGGDISSVVFQFCAPLAVINGEYMVLQFLNAIVPEIQKENRTSNKEQEKKMAKYMKKYPKRL